MTMVAKYDVLDETVTYPEPLTPQQAWRSAIATLATQARKALPDSNGRIDLAVKIVLNGDVEMLPDGQAWVSSQSDPVKRYLVNGGCFCPDAGKAPSGLCKHRLAKALYTRALVLAKTLVARGTTVSTAAEVPEETQTSRPATHGPDDPDHAPAVDSQEALQPVSTPEPPAPPLSIPPQFLVEIQGKPFITFHGLLHLAHQQGLLSLSARFISVTADLALAEATAKFSNGHTFSECGDATPQNVNGRIKPHFARMALTRAKARALRDALDIAIVAVEELE